MSNPTFNILGTGLLLAHPGLLNKPSVATSLMASSRAITSRLPIFADEQTGTWIGQWIAIDTKATTGILAGDMTLNIVKDPLLGTATSFAALELNAFLGAGISLSGSVSNKIVILKGAVVTTFGPKPLTVDIICTIGTPTHMTGTYQSADYIGGNVQIYEIGTFDLSLSPPLIS